MNIVDVIDATLPEIIDMAKLLENIEKRLAKINDIKFTLLGDDQNKEISENEIKKGISFKINDNNVMIVRDKLVQINRLNCKNFEDFLDLNAIIKSAYDSERYTLHELLIDVVPDYITTHIFFEEYQLYTIAQSFKLTSKEVLKNKRLNINFESNGYSFSLKHFILNWIANDFYIDALAGFIPPFVKTKEEAIKLKNACWSLYSKKYAFDNGADVYEKVKYGLNSLFSILDMNANPFGDYDNVDKNKEKKSDIIVPLRGGYQR